MCSCGQDSRLLTRRCRAPPTRSPLPPLPVQRRSGGQGGGQRCARPLHPTGHHGCLANRKVCVRRFVGGRRRLCCHWECSHRQRCHQSQERLIPLQHPAAWPPGSAALPGRPTPPAESPARQPASAGPALPAQPCWPPRTCCTYERAYTHCTAAAASHAGCAPAASPGTLFPLSLPLARRSCQQACPALPVPCISSGPTIVLWLAAGAPSLTVQDMLQREAVGGRVPGGSRAGVQVRRRLTAHYKVGRDKWFVKTGAQLRAMTR